MKKIIVIALIIVMTLAMAACGGSASDSGGGMAEESKSSGSYGFGNFLADGSDEGGDYDAAEEPAEAAEGRNDISIGLPSSLNKENVKLIFSADMNVQTLDFDEAEKGLYSLVEKVGGYFEYISQDNGSWYDDEDSYKYAHYTVRVPSDKFQEFITSVNEGMHVVNMNQNAQDVGQAYFDTERRLETLKNKHDRLEQLLSNATEMTDIIELETALSDTEYQIEQYTSDLQRYDSLIDYSTVNINVEKVTEYATGITEELTFWQRLGRSVKQGAADFGWWLGDLANWIGYHIIQLVILAVLIIGFVRFGLVQKIKGIIGGKKQQKYVVIQENKAKETETKE